MVIVPIDLKEERKIITCQPLIILRTRLPLMQTANCRKGVSDTTHNQITEPSFPRMVVDDSVANFDS